MIRFASGKSLACVLPALVILSACSTSKTTTVITQQVPASVTLCLTPATTCAAGTNSSVEVGQSQALLATGRNNQGTTLAETFSYLSSNPAVLTVANNGDACAGTWDSLTLPAVCTPGPTGVAQVTAVAHGVSSPPLTIYVHQRITRVTINKVPNQPATMSNTCFSAGAPSGPESTLYEAFAFSGAADITSTVGPFGWQAVLVGGQTTSSVTLTTPPAGSPLNQELATSSAPGISPFFATVGGFHSQTAQFETCPVESIAVAALGNPGTSFVVNAGVSTTLNATVTDSLGMNLVGVPLTWSSTNPISVTASGTTSTVYGSVGTASAVAVGAADVIASCTPPTCNGGFSPSLPIYPQAAMSFNVGSTSAPASPVAYATSTGCGASPSTCVPTVVPINRASAAVQFSLGIPVSIPSAPNSILFDPHGGSAYLGVNSSALGTQGLITFNGSSASRVTNVSGTVLAVSPDSTLSVLSNTADSPNEVFVCTGCNTSSNAAATFQINGATAAAFSPDSLKADIVAGNTLYVYSQLDALKTIALSAPANDVAFFPEGAFAYVAGGASSAVTVWRNCDDTLVDTVATSTVPQMIRALPDAATVAVLDPPYLELIHVTPNGLLSGCTPLVSDAVSGRFNLGQGNFTPSQFLVSPDGSAAYILGGIPQAPPNPPQRFPFVIAFNFASESPSFISLTAGAVPLSASISPASDLLFVGADDGAVHVINTATGADVQQITFPFPGNSLCYGLGTPTTDVQTFVSISGAAQTGASTTYNYTLTSGPALVAGGSILITNMGDPRDNGTFTITAVGSGTFTVTNPNGVNAAATTGTGRAGIICNPDLVAVRP